jgi:DNA gyrase/topoisomerase IV subunit A
MKSPSEYIESEHRIFSLYVLQSRALPSIADGLKASGRRLLWTAKDGKKVKTATLAGQTMSIHPHAEASGAANSLAGPYINNIPLFDGIGSFGTKLNPQAFGASRYTSVQISNFTKDVVFADIDLVPLQASYDDLNQEPKHFLPLVPMSLVNSVDGIAVGFACSILPRRLSDIIDDQIAHLQKKKVPSNRSPYYKPMDCEGYQIEEGNKWWFDGAFKRVGKTQIKIIKLPPQQSHEQIKERLCTLVENKDIVDFTDNSKDTIDIDIKFKITNLSDYTDKQLLKLLKLTQSSNENMNVVSFDGEQVLSTNYKDHVTSFTDWRLQYYLARYQRLAGLVEEDIQRYKDIILAIKKNVGGLAKKIANLGEMKEVLDAFGIVNIDYIASLPVYRFTEEERDKTQKKLDDAEDQLATYQSLIDNDKLRIKQFIKELKEVRTKYGV